MSSKPWLLLLLCAFVLATAVPVEDATDSQQHVVVTAYIHSADTADSSAGSTADSNPAIAADCNPSSTADGNACSSPDSTPVSAADGDLPAPADSDLTMPAASNASSTTDSNLNPPLTPDSDHPNITANITADTQWYYDTPGSWDGGDGGHHGDQWDSGGQLAASLPSCPPGQGRPSPSEPCQLCPYGRYSPGGLRGPCLRCPPYTVTITPGATECGCQPGTGTLTISEGPCMPCPDGTYSPGGSVSPCLRCPGSAFMVTPPFATRVSQCTCQAGYGSTIDFPLSCQMCPIGTYADALSEIINIPGVPPQGGKGITRGVAGATVRRCKPCCPAGVGTCGLTTARPGAQSYTSCVLVAPTNRPYCCGVSNCTIKVPEPPPFITQSAAAAAAAAAAKPDFQTTYRGASVTVVMPHHVVDGNGRLVIPEPRAPEMLRSNRQPSGSSGSSWGGGSSGSSSWGRSSSGGNSWDSSSSSSSGGGDRNSGGGGGSSSWGGGGGGSGSSGWGGGGSSIRGRSWGATITGSEAISPDSLVTLTLQDIEGADDTDSSSSSEDSISSTAEVSWWGGPTPRPLAICSANPRIEVTNPVGLAANTPWVLSYWADMSATTTCEYTAAKFALSACTGSQISPYLVLTASHCIEPTNKRVQYNCPNLVLAQVVLCYSFTRQPQGSFQCSNGLNAVGASWNDHPNTTDPYDQAIVFTAIPRPPPYYQYNYIENIPTAYNSSANTFQSLSYSGDGNNATKSCGCYACSNVPCNVARSGPAPGPLVPDPRLNSTSAPAAVNANLEACAGSSGNCMTINGQSCCIAVDSYEYLPNDSGTACSSTCSNYWSVISVNKPLSNLWGTVRQKLPAPPTP